MELYITEELVKFPKMAVLVDVHNLQIWEITELNGITFLYIKGSEKFYENLGKEAAIFS